MIDNNPRNIAFNAYNQMYKSGWELPFEIRQLAWIQKIISSDPYDAVQTGVRIIATIPMSISYQPLAPSLENRDRAGTIEKVCKWQLKSANRRRSRTVEAEIAKTALLYDMCAVKTVDLEYEIKQKTYINADSKREERALATGRFMVIPYDPRDVHPIWSNIGLEGVLVVQHRRAQEVLDEFGDKAKAHPALVKLAVEPHDSDWVTYYDYTDFDTRSIWVDEGRTFARPGDGIGRWQIDHGSNPLPFLNWSIKGGSELETDPTHKFQPLLYPVYATGAWDIKNIIMTLGVSEVIAHTGSPRFVEEGPNPQQAVIDYRSPERIAKMPPQNVLKTLEPPGIDQALSNVEAMLNSQLDKQMVSAILQGGELPAGIAFATLNLVTQTAIGVLNPAKDLAQKTLADVTMQFLLWTAHTEKPLYGFETAGKTVGTELAVQPDELDVKSIYIDVELHPDAPSDKAQSVTTAGMMVAQLGLSQESALEEIGIEDPAEELKRSLFERLAAHELDMQLQRELLEMQNELQLDLMEEQMKMEMASQQGGEEAPAPQGGEESLGGEQEVAPEEQGPSPSLNPAEGALPPAMFAPEDNAEGAGFPQETAPLGESI